MQAKTTTEAGSQAPKNGSGGSVTLKNFHDLAVALTDAEIEHFALNIRQGIDHWRTAGKLLVDMTKKHPEAMTRIREKTGLTDAVLQTFARIGRNEIWPPLLVDSSLGARKLLECHYQDQKRYAEEPIDVVIEWKDGKTKTIKKKVSDLSRAECAVVFDGRGGINNLDQQGFRLRGEAPAKLETLKHSDPAPVYQAPRAVNVDIGYFSVVMQPDGTVTQEPCGKSAMAQPVRMVKNGKGYQSAIVLYYKQEMK